MPTLVRLLSLVVLLVGMVVGVMAALVTFVEPRQAQIVVPVPLPTISASPAAAEAEARAESERDDTATGSLTPVTVP